MIKTAARLSAACALALVLAACAPTTDDGFEPPAIEMTPQPVVPRAQDTADDSPQDTADDAGASQVAALDAYVAKEQAQVPAILEASPGTYSEVAISPVYPDAVEYAYHFAQQIDPAEASTYFDGMVPTFQSACDTQVFPAMASLGVTPTQKATYTYYNADGSQLWSHTFESS